MSFGASLARAMREYGPLCAGIDPDPATLASWGLEDSPAGLETFADTMLHAAVGHAAAIKPNAAFFERHGSAGVAVLERLLAGARASSVLTVLDAKRGDIGSTMTGYAQSYLLPGAPLEADSVTLSPYLGFGSLAPALNLAAQHGKGIFVLALTSNPEGSSVQHAVASDGRAVARVVAEEAAAINDGAAPMGSVGLVVGATIGDAAQRLGIDLAAVNGPLLSPGVGAQGAGQAEIARVFAGVYDKVLVNQSRGIAKAGPDVDALRGAMKAAAAEAKQLLDVTHAGE